MAQQNDPNADKSSFNILWGIFGIFALVLLIWYFFGDQIKYGFVVLKIWEAKLTILYDQTLVGFTQELALFLPESRTLTMDLASFISAEIGKILRWPIIINLGFFALYLGVLHPGMRYTKIYDTKKLFAQEKKIWPHVTPIEKLNLAQQDIDQGPWAMAMTAIPFCKKHKLLEIELVPNPDAAWKRDPIAKMKLKKAHAYRVLARQIGPHFVGVEHLPIHTKALFAAFAARIGRDAKGANALLEQISRSSTSARLDFSGTDALLKKHVKNEIVQDVLNSHAFVLTIMAGLLKKARDDGVVATSSFLWLKPKDRQLWYMLNCIGRQVAFPEVAGPFAHFKTELELGRPLKVPMIETAVVGFEDALKEQVYNLDKAELQELIQKQQGVF